MPVGTSLGQLFDDDFHYFQNQHDPDKFPSTGELKPPETPDSNVLTPKGLEGNKNQATDPDLEIPITQRLDVYRTNPPEMPPGAPTEVTGAFKSSEATQVAPSTNASPEASYSPPSEGVTPASQASLPDFTNDRPHDWVERTAIAAGKAFQLPGDVLSGKVQPGSIQEIERATDLAGLMVAGPAPVASKMADGTLGSFAGVASKTLDKTKLYEAQQMALDKIHPDEIWQKTGFFKGADERWRYEIPDVGSRIKSENLDKIPSWNDKEMTQRAEDLVSIPSKKDFFGREKDSMRLPDVLEHPELFRAYPGLNALKVAKLSEDLVKENIVGQMDTHTNTLYIAPHLDPDYAKSIMLHEIQHDIQEREGFSKGANFMNFLKNNAPDMAKEKYKRVAGEVEARNVQSRMNFNDVKRYYNSPRTTEDRPRFVQTDPSHKN